MEERVLLRSSDNISKLLTLMINHEQNVKNYFRRNNVIQFVFEQNDISMNDLSINDLELNIDISNVSYRTFHELENKNENVCSITQELFNPEDNVALLQCGHYFKKNAFLLWSRRSRTCPTCRLHFVP
jgi:hypothetical protein